MSAFSKDFWRSVWKSKVRFLSILAIVFLGTWMFAGMWAICPDMQHSMDSYCDDSNLMDIQLVSSWGFTNEDIEAIRQTDGIQQVCGGYRTDRMADVSGNGIAVRVQSLLTDADGENSINQLTLLDGRMPEAPNECVIIPHTASDQVAKIGDSITVKSSEEEEILAYDTFTVVGVAQTPEYLLRSLDSVNQGRGTLDCVLYVPPQAFDSDVFTVAYATVEGAAALNSFSDEYLDLIDSEKDRLLQTADVQEEARYRQTVNDAWAEWNQSNAEYQAQQEEAESQLTAAKQQLDESEAQLDAAQKQLEDGYASYQQGVKTLAEKEQQAQTELATAKQSLSEKQLQLTDAFSKLGAEKQQLDLWQRQLDSAKAQAVGMPDEILENLEQEQAKLSQAMALWQQQSDQLQMSQQQLQEAEVALSGQQQTLENELFAAQKQLDALSQQLKQGESELSLGREKLEEARNAYVQQEAQVEQQLADGQRQLDSAREQIEQLTPPEWYVTDRLQNTGYASFRNDSLRMNSLSTIFPVVFFLVAALVALTTMTRMVGEERGMSGTCMALGYSNFKIASRYLLYASFATMSGGILGIALGFLLLPTIIWKAYTIIYYLPQIQIHFWYGIALAALALALLCTIGSTVLTLRRMLAETPASLMRPKAPKTGKKILLERIQPLWKRISFFWKVTTRNLLLNKRRAFMTIIGVAGCTALLLTGFGVKDSVNMILSVQFEDIYQYQATVGLDPDQPSDELTQFMQAPDHFEGTTRVMNAVYEADYEGNSDNVYLYVPEDVTTISQFIQFRTRKGHHPIDFTDDSVIITEQLANTMGISIGDTICLKSIGFDSSEAFVTVTDITENYINNYVYLSPSVYQEIFGEPPSYNQYLVRATEDEEDLFEQLRTLDGVSCVIMTQDIIDPVQDSLDSINTVIMVLVVAAAVLALVVLYNLTNINICERIREIATLKVLGLFDREINSYIYRETVVFTAAGCLLGLLFGRFLFRFVIQTVEMDYIMLGRSIQWQSYLLSILLTFVFAFLVHLMMSRKMKKIDMIESLKSVE